MHVVCLLLRATSERVCKHGCILLIHQQTSISIKISEEVVMVTPTTCLQPSPRLNPARARLQHNADMDKNCQQTIFIFKCYV